MRVNGQGLRIKQREAEGSQREPAAPQELLKPVCIVCAYAYIPLPVLLFLFQSMKRPQRQSL